MLWSEGERDVAGELNLRVEGEGLILRSKELVVRTDHIVLRFERSFELNRTGAGGNVHRTYTGELEASRDGTGTLRLINRVPIETYVRSVANTETGPTPSLNESARRELLHAMETIVRSYALAHPDRHAKRDYDLCDLTHCMVYAGSRGSGSRSKIGGEPRLLIGDDRFLPAYFHSTCGGRLATPASYWPGAPAGNFYRAGADRLAGDDRDLCAASPHHRWRADVARGELHTMLGVPRTRAPLSFRLRRRDERVTALEWQDTVRPRMIPIAKFASLAGRRFGWNAIKSNDFELQQRGERVVFRGRGLGHGIGLCQWGAREQAARGRTGEEILRFYYPGARIATGRYTDASGADTTAISISSARKTMSVP